MRGQRQAVLDYLQKNKSITSIEAYDLFGATRLAALIFEYRKRGYDIDTINMTGKNRYGEVVNYAKYVYHGRVSEV